MTNRHHTPATLTLLFIGVAYLAGRLFGPALTGEHWAFLHWRALPGWYPLLWVGLTALIAWGVVFHAERLAGWFERPRSVRLALLGLLALMVTWTQQSFLFGGGNIRVAQVAQADRILLHWWEYGSVGLTAIFFRAYSLLGMSDNTAGVLAWRTLSYLSTALSLAAAATLAGQLSREPVRRLHLFLVGFFGPQTMLYFGFVGLEPVVIPVTLWFGAVSLQVMRRLSIRRLAVLWILTGAGVLMHITLVFLVPAAMAVTIAAVGRSDGSLRVGIASGLAMLAVGVGWLYQEAAESLRLAARLLLLHGKPAFIDYSLFSGRRLVDLLALLFLVAPFIPVFLLLPRSRSVSDAIARVGPLWALTAAGGFIALFVLDPVNSIVMDTPRLVAYLTPLSLVALFLLARADLPAGSRLPGWLAAAAIAVPLAYVPTYQYLSSAERYVAAYFDKHPVFWRTGGIALRDAWYYERNFDKANAWEQALPVKSPDYLNIRGCRDLLATGQIDDAVPVLHRMIAGDPYWPEPRSLLASAHLAMKRFRLAKAQIDTALMLDPENRQHLRTLAQYYRDLGMIGQALQVVTDARKLYPHDSRFAALEMTYRFIRGDTATADSLAEWVMQVDSALPDPYLLKAWLADRAKDYPRAATYYRRFLARARARDPDRPAAEQRLKQLQELLKQSP